MKIIQKNIVRFMMTALMASLMSLARAAEPGEADACLSPSALSAGETVDGVLDTNDCVSASGRLQDYYEVTLSDPGTLLVEMTSEDFQTLVGVYSEDGNELLGYDLGDPAANLALPAGTYWLFASTAVVDADAPPQGAYTLNVTESEVPQQGCGDEFTAVPGTIVQGSFSATDCIDMIAHDSDEVDRYNDGYRIYVEANETLYATLVADIDFRFSWWMDDVNVSPLLGLPADRARTMAISSNETPMLHRLYALADEHQATGSYTLTFSTEPPVSPPERAALIDLYNATDGDNWTNNTGWLDVEGTECSWHGVHCDGTGELLALDVQNNGLNGQIPVAIGDLENLVFLGLANNDGLAGTIPAEIGNLSNLTTLALHNNGLTGQVPIEIGDLEQLEHLYLMGNALTGEIPASIGNLTALKTLHLLRNHFTGAFPTAIQSLTNLEVLWLADNQFSGPLPMWLDHLTNLRLLHLWSNDFSGEIPANLGQLTQLTTLHLYSNNLTGQIPAELGQLDTLLSLNLQLNQLEGSLPPAIGSLTELEYLDLGGNQLSGSLPAELGDLVNLTELYLWDNQFSGELPNSLTNLTSLTSAGIAGNCYNTSDEALIAFLDGADEDWHLQGDCAEPVPDFGDSQACENPPALSLETVINGTLDAGTDCFIESGRMSDRFLVELTEPTVLRTTVEAADFTPLISASELPSEAVIVQRYSETGTVMVEYALPAGDYRIAVTSYEADPDAPLTGSYTLTTEVLGESQSACISNSAVVAGTVTDGYIDSDDCEDQSAIGNGHRLDNYVIWLQEGAQLEVTLSSDFNARLFHWISGGELTSTDVADQGNGVSYHMEAAEEGYHHFYVSPDVINEEGSYTLEFSTPFDPGVSQAEREALIALYNATDGHNWTNNDGWLGEAGSECTWHGVACNGEERLVRLELSGNNLDGQLPADIGNLTQLSNLNLADNNLVGQIPVELWDLTSLHWIVLWSNSFEGELPAAVGNLTQLRGLDLGGSQLTGSLPVTLGNLVNLTELYLWGNQFSGELPNSLTNLTSLTSAGIAGNCYNTSDEALIAFLDGVDEDWHLQGDCPEPVPDFGNLQACENPPALFLETVINGTLDTDTDCFIESGRMSDRFLVELTEPTVLRTTVEAADFTPLISASQLPSEALLIQRVTGTGTVMVEYALPAGDYRIAVTSYEADPDAPPTGGYILTTELLDESQTGCRDSAVVAGTVTGGNINSDDCEDQSEIGNGHRLDGYVIWLHEGARLDVTLSSDFSARLSHWALNSYVTSTEVVEQGNSVSYRIEAGEEGYHQFYVSPDVIDEEGNYTLEF
ncbi:MAG: hypothetical protein WEB57_03325, partial [Pseudohongiellaceae bacterium]